MSGNDRHQLADPVETAFRPAISTGRRGTCIRVAINDTAINDVIDCEYDRVILERSVDSGLTWCEITTPDQRPVLEANKTSYVIVDSTGDPNYLYRTRYIETKTGDLSEASEDISGAGLAIQGLLTVAQLKQRYLFGIDTTNDAGEELPDAVYEFYIASAVRSLEHELDIPIFPTTFCEYHDYYRSDYHAFQIIRLDNRPLITLDEFLVQYPSGQSVVSFPPEWFRLNKPEGHVQIVPTAGTLSEILVGQGGSFLPAIYNGQDYLPQLFLLTYQAGFGTGQVPANILDIIGKLASMGPFNIFGDLIAGAGIANLSLSLDGLSQTIGTTASATNAGFGARLGQYAKEIKEKLPMLRRYYQGMRMVVA